MLVVLQYADVAELADALDLGSSVYDVQVQLLSSAVFFCLTKKNKMKKVLDNAEILPFCVENHL